MAKESLVDEIWSLDCALCSGHAQGQQQSLRAGRSGRSLQRISGPDAVLVAVAVAAAAAVAVAAAAAAVAKEASQQVWCCPRAPQLPYWSNR